jgi:hypothetical protein
MKKLNLMALGLAFASVSTMSVAGTVITEWTYINEAGFQNATTGRAVDLNLDANGTPTTLEPDVNSPDYLKPLDSTGMGASTYTNEVYNPVTNMYYDLGSAGYVAGSSQTGDTQGASGKLIGTSIFEEVGITTGDLYDEICWGHGPSCISFSDSQGGDTSRVEGVATVDANGGTNWNNGTNMVHSNNPTGAPSLTSIDVFDGLKLFSGEIFGGQLPLLELGFNVIFNETFREAGEIWDYAPDDAFIVTLDPLLGAIADFGPDYIDISQQFDLTGFVGPDYHTDYEVIVRISGLETIVDDQSGSVFGLITPENQTSELLTQFSIRAVGVAEPATLAIFGLGLLGLGATRRRKA